MEKEEDLEDQVLEDTHLQLLQKDLVDLVMLEDFQFLKEIMVERETIQITEAAEAVAVLLLTELMDQDTQEQPEEQEQQIILQGLV